MTMLNGPYTAVAHDVPTLSPDPLMTSGNLQLVVLCPRCSVHHRHLGLGLRRGPCGAWYILGEPGKPGVTLRAA